MATTMNAELNDNDYRVPDITADDVWADPEWLHEPGQRFLPPKRVNGVNGHTAGPNGHEGGLRIGSALQASSHAVETAGTGLEVAVISGEVVRLAPEIPSAERVPRQFTFHQRPADEGNHHLTAGEAREWGRSQKASRQSILWFAGSGLAVCLVVVGALMMLPRINRSNAMEPRPGQTELVIAKDTTDAAKPITEMLARQKEAERLYQAWLTATSRDDIPHLVRNPEAALARITDDALPKLAPQQAVPARGATWNALDKGGLVFGMLEGELPDHTAFGAYFVLVDGALRMDWQATTAHGSADFATLARGGGDAAEIRGWIKPADFYTLAFPEERYQSYQLLSPDQSSSLWVYTRREDPAHHLLSGEFDGGAILSGTPQPGKFTLRLEAGPEDALPNQWLIVELLHKDWIAP
jgi:hypothetical protein